MKTIEINLVDALYRTKSNDPEIAFTYDGSSAYVGSRLIVTPAIMTPSRQKMSKQGNLTISRATQVLEYVKNVKRVGNDLYGEININGADYFFKTDGGEVWTNCNDESHHRPMLRLALLPLVLWQEDKSAEMREFREKVEKGTATKEDYIKYGDVFYYDYAVNSLGKIQVNLDCSTDKVVPAVSKAPTVITGVISGLPWLDQSVKADNDFSVASAKAGKYRLNLNYGVVTDNEGNEYDMSKDVLPLSFLDDYVDNPSYRQVLRGIVGVITSAVRANKLDLAKGSVNEVFADCKVSSLLRNIMLTGEPGNGKTRLLRAVAATLGLPVTVLNLSALSEADAITEQIRVTSAGYTTIKSQLYWYVKNGGLFIFDDFSNSDTNTLFASIGGLLEEPCQLQVGQTQIKRHPLCFIAAACNIGTEGSRAINEALISRFPNPIVVEKLDAAVFKAVVIEKAKVNTGIELEDKSAKALGDWVYDVYSGAVKAVQMRNADLAERVVTMRGAISLTEKILSNLAMGIEMNAIDEAISAFANGLYVAGEPEIRDVVKQSITSKSVTALSAVRI